MKLHYQELSLQTKHAFHTARSPSSPIRRSVWVKLLDTTGIEGWGEAAAASYYGETPETVMAVLPALGELLEKTIQEDVFAIDQIEKSIEGFLGQNPSTRAAISVAVHDLIGKKLSLPIWKLFGLSPKTAPLSSFTIGIDTPEMMRKKVQEAASYPILKIKVGTLNDEKSLALIRDEAPEKILYVDANTAWTSKEALQKIPMLESYQVALLEQPLAPNNKEGLRLLQKHSSIPIIADESCRTSEDILSLLGCVDGINIKLSKCGSLREALRMIHIARAHNLLVMLGCMLESTLGIAAAIQLAPLVDYADLDGALLVANDPFQGPGMNSDGTLRFNQTPGLGVTPV